MRPEQWISKITSGDTVLSVAALADILAHLFL